MAKKAKAPQISYIGFHLPLYLKKVARRLAEAESRTLANWVRGLVEKEAKRDAEN